jgi:gamma-glutamyl phosphate reductase
MRPVSLSEQGGKEAMRSNALLHRLIVDAVAEVAPGVGRDVIGLVTRRDEIDGLLKLNDVIDLVIPRGSNELVRSRAAGWSAGTCTCAVGWHLGWHGFALFSVCVA